MWAVLLAVGLAWAGDLTVVFGSCAKQGEPQPIWRAIGREDADAVVLLGDNVYIDSMNPSDYPAAYARLAAKRRFARVRAGVPLYAVWDDHDYGQNDAGAEWPLKDVARDAFLGFLGAPDDDPRRAQDGVYGAWWLSESPRVQLVLLDTRWSRTPLPAGPRDRAAGKGPYLPDDRPAARMLGDAQWAWLAAVLAQPADVRIVGSSIPVLPYFTGWETWSNLPREQARLLRMLDEAGGAVLISGDTHWGELSVREAGLSAPLWELTSSGLTETWNRVPENLFRADDRAFVGQNYGRIVISEDTVELSLHDRRGETVWTQQL